MAFTFRFDARGFVEVTSDAGPNDPAACVRSVGELAADPRFTPGMGILADMRADRYTPSMNDSGRLVHNAARPDALAGHPLALLVAGPLQVGAANQMAALAAGRGLWFQVFLDPDEAVRWLMTVAPGRDADG